MTIDPDKLEEVVSFLMGSGPLRGCWFGERPDDAKGAFWWRTDLRAALDERAALRHDLDRSIATASELATENAALTARVAALERALKPFAREAYNHDRAGILDGHWFEGDILFHDLRLARQALEDNTHDQ